MTGPVEIPAVMMQWVRPLAAAEPRHHGMRFRIEVLDGNVLIWLRAPKDCAIAFTGWCILTPELLRAGAKDPAEAAHIWQGVVTNLKGQIEEHRALLKGLGAYRVRLNYHAAVRIRMRELLAPPPPGGGEPTAAQKNGKPMLIGIPKHGKAA